MIFPVATIRIRKCLAVIATKNRKSTAVGEPITEGVYIAIHRGKSWTAYRLAFHLNVKKIKRKSGSRKRGLVCHTCDHKWCIEPTHLYLGTAKNNVDDMFARNKNIRKSLSEGLKRYLSTPEGMEARKASLRGVKRKVYSSNFKGRHHTPEARKKISEIKRRMNAIRRGEL